MFDIDKSHCVTTEQKLLWNILESLKPTETPLLLPFEEPIKNKVELCKLCGFDHSNVGKRLACARKFKKERG